MLRLPLVIAVFGLSACAGAPARAPEKTSKKDFLESSAFHGEAMALTEADAKPIDWANLLKPKPSKAGPADGDDWMRPPLLDDPQEYPQACNDPELSEGKLSRTLTPEQCQQVCQETGAKTFGECAASIDPLIIDLDADGIATGPRSKGVVLDVSGVGRRPTRISWVIEPTTSVFLVKLRADGGRGPGIEPLFGNALRDGFAELATDDADAAGAADGSIDADDTIWPRLRGWRDANLDGRMEDAELATLDAIGIKKIDLAAAEIREADAYGNISGKRSVVCLGNCAASPELWVKAGIYDVFFQRAFGLERWHSTTSRD